MSHKKHQFWVMMPVLGILLMSPKDVQTKYGRSIASDEPAPAAPSSVEARPASQTPKLDQLITTLTVPARQNPVNLNSDNLKEEISTALSKVSKAEEYSRETVLVPVLDKHLDEIKAAAISLVQVENSIKDLINPDDSGDIRSRISEAKIILEASLKDLDETRIAVARRDATPAAPVVVAAPAAPVVTPTPSAARAPGVVAAETTVAADPKKDDKKEEKDPILCALEEQNKLLQQQLQGFVQQQSLIMQQLMQLSQMVMMQSMYRTPDTFNYREAYQYHQPQVAGNWVYYPNGLQPIQPGQQVPGQMDQSNIFGLNQPQMQPPMGMGGYGMPQMGGMMGGYGMPMQPQMQQPGMLNQGGQWGLAPQMGSGQTPGSFGGMDAMGFNMNTPATGAPMSAPMSAPMGTNFGSFM